MLHSNRLSLSQDSTDNHAGVVRLAGLRYLRLAPLSLGELPAYQLPGVHRDHHQKAYRGGEQSIADKFVDATRRGIAVLTSTIQLFAWSR